MSTLPDSELAVKKIAVLNSISKQCNECLAILRDEWKDIASVDVDPAVKILMIVACKREVFQVLDSMHREHGRPRPDAGPLETKVVVTCGLIIDAMKKSVEQLMIELVEKARQNQ